MDNHYFEKLFAGVTKIENPWVNRPSYEEQMKFLRSKENLEICRSFIAECQRLANAAKKYENQFQTLKDQLSKEIVLEKYSTGGEGLYRGYYCPSPIMDIVMRNCNRGRLLSRITKRSKPTFKYGFNVDGNLILATNFRYDIDAIGTEIILRDGKKETGISFQEWDGERRLEQLSESIYRDNRIISFINCFYLDYDNSVSIYNREEYTYSNEGLGTAHMYRFSNHKGTFPILNHEEYRFKHDNDGYLSQFTVIEYPGSSMRTEPYWNGCVYDIRLKRKGVNFVAELSEGYPKITKETTP